MAADFSRAKSIKYLNKDFQSFKRDLIKFSQPHHSGVFQDFNESSPGMALLELTAYIGDVLSFYQDMQFEELKGESATQVENVVSFAKARGYRPQGKRAARGTLAFFVEVPSTTRDGAVVPDNVFAPLLRKGAAAQGPNGVVVETLDDVDFSASLGRFVTGSRFDQATGLPTHFALRKDVDIVAGETKTDSVSVGDFEQFKTIELSNGDVIEVMSIFDSDGNEWVEVEHLAQDMVFEAAQNGDEDNDVVPYVLRFVSAPRRFITDRNPLTEKTSLIFGSGDGLSFDDELVPNLADFALPLMGRRTFAAFALDPQNFLRTQSLGLSPHNTTLTITYRVGGGLQTNVAAGSIKSVKSAVLDFSSTGLDAVKKGAVETSLECANFQKTQGGADAESIGEIKANAAAAFAAQSRAVTREDIIARIMSIPAKFGKPDKVYVRRDGISPLAIDAHILARDENKHLVIASPNLKQNIATYLTPFRMMTDGINILDSTIVNLRLAFGVVVSSKNNRTEVLSKCLDTMRSALSTDNMQIGQPLVLSDLSAKLQDVAGVISVYRLEFSSVFGTVDGLSYSSARFDVSGHTVNGIVYCPENSIFEVKYPTRDIVGTAK